MAPKLEIKSQLGIKDLLSYQYDPAGYKQSAFHEHYQKLVEHRDELQKRFNDKEERRASLREPDATPSQGSRFSSLPDDDDGSSSSALTKPTLSASLSNKQLDKLSDNERKAAVRKIKEEIETIKKEMKAQKKKDNESRKEAKNPEEEVEHRETVQKDEEETNGSDQDQGWQIAKASFRR